MHTSLAHWQFVFAHSNSQPKATLCSLVIQLKYSMAVDNEMAMPPKRLRKDNNAHSHYGSYHPAFKQEQNNF